MSVVHSAGFEKRRQVRRRFRRAEPAGEEKLCLRGDWRERFARLLPAEVLREIAGRCGALDVRCRKVTCVIFFWAAVLALSKAEAVTLSSVAREVGVAGVLAGLDSQWHGVSRQTISENLACRPWTFFAAVFKYLVSSYVAHAAGPVAGLGAMQQLDIFLVDSTMIRLAESLASAFATYPTPKSSHWAAAQAHVRLDVLGGFPEVLNLTNVKADELDSTFLCEPRVAALYIFDLGYWCYALLDDIIDRQQHFVSRLKASANPLIKDVRLGEGQWKGHRLKEIQLAGSEVDLTVNLTCAKATAKQRRGARRSLSERRALQGHRGSVYMQHDVRLVGYWSVAHQRWFFYVTSLTHSDNYPVSLICNLYRLRWQVEIFFRNLKGVLGLRRFVSRSENGIRIQLYAAIICYILTRLVVLQAASETGRPSEDFSMPYCLAIVRHLLSDLTIPLLMTKSDLNCEPLERILVSAVIAQGLRPNRTRPALLTSIRQRLPQPSLSLS